MSAALDNLQRSRLQLQASLQSSSQENHAAVGGTTGLLLQTLLQPLAMRKPLQLVLSAFALGMVVVWGRPWRWVERGDWMRKLLLRGALSQIISKLLSPKRAPE